MTHVAIHKHKLQAPVMYSLGIIVHQCLTAFFQQVVFVVTITFDFCSVSETVISVVTINFDFCSVSGTVISGYQVNNTYNLIGKGNPQWPQAFYPVENKVVIQRDDYLVREISDPMSQPKSWQIFNTTYMLLISNLTFTLSSVGWAMYI